MQSVSQSSVHEFCSNILTKLGVLMYKSVFLSSVLKLHWVESIRC